MKSEIVKRIIDSTPQHTKDFVKMYGDAKVATSDVPQTGTNTLVSCRANFKGTITKKQLYIILEYIDDMKQRGYTFETHERTDNGDMVTINYSLVKHGS